jgi:hypothetical protein
MRTLLALLALSSPAALACPTIATGTPAQLSFDTAQVVLVHQDGRTTFSVSINPEGNSQDFALVLPVPTMLEEGDIRTLDSDIFAQLDGYSAPRRLDDAGCGYQAVVPCWEDYPMADAGESGGEGGGAVDIEATYLVGSYVISILSAEESTDLKRWLDDNGYYLPEGAEERLAEYIEAGSYFLVAKVSAEATSADGTPLMPLQVSYASEVMTIPIRLAALSAVENQDMVIYTLTPESQGRVGLSNYPEFSVPETCVWGTEHPGNFSADQGKRFDAAWAATGGAAWTLEFADLAGNCSPCTNVNPFQGTYEGDVLSELGFDATSGDWPYLTRLHMRYNRETAVEDLMLYTTNITEPEVLTYADANEGNFACIETWCDGSPTDPPPETVYEECDEEAAASAEEGDAGKGCAHGPAASGWLAALGLALLGRRRRG